MESKQIVGPNCLPLLSFKLVTTGFQHCDGHKILGVLIFVTCNTMVGHLAKVLGCLVVGFMITPSIRHWVLISFDVEAIPT